jgi:translation initiation factor 1
MPEEKSKLVFSTDKAIPRKKSQEKALQAIARPDQRTVTVRSGQLLAEIRIGLERKGRGGKAVPIIDGLRIPRHEQGMLLKELKTILGTGGTLKDASLEIQGDHRDAIIGIMQKKGYKPKRSGG